MMLAMCLATVAGLMTSSAPMPLLLRPSATSLAICSSLGVSALGGEAGGRRCERRSRGLRRRRRRGRRLKRDGDRRRGRQLQAARPQLGDGGVAETAGGGEVALGARAGQRRQAGRLAQRGSGGGEQHGTFRLIFADRERGERLEAARHPDTRSGVPAEPQAFREVLPGERGRPCLGRHAAETGQAARDLRPGVDLPQVCQRLHVLLAGVGEVAAQLAPGRRDRAGRARHPSGGRWRASRRPTRWPVRPPRASGRAARPPRP